MLNIRRAESRIKNKKQKEKFKATEMDLRTTTSCKSQMERIRNKILRERMTLHKKQRDEG